MLEVNSLEGIYLGVRGENRARTIQIDVSAWLVGHPNASVAIFHKRNGAPNKEATGATFDAQTGIITWIPTNWETYNAGEGVAEIRLTEGNVIKKSRDVPTGVSRSIIGPAGEMIESNWQAYLNDMETKKSTAIQAMLDAEAWANGTRNGEPVTEDDPAYEKNAKFFSEVANGAPHAELTAEAWAVGTRNGQEVPTTDPTHHNNSLWWYQKTHEDYEYVRDSAAAVTRAEAAARDAEAAAATAAAAVQIVGSEFSEEIPYYENETVLHSGAMYRFIQDHPAGAWNASHVVREGVDDQLNGIYSGRAERAFAHLGFYIDTDGDVCQED